MCGDSGSAGVGTVISGFAGSIPVQYLSNKNGEEALKTLVIDFFTPQFLFSLLSSSVPVMMPGFLTRSNL